MYLQFLGTGAGSPSRFRNVSALAFKFDAEIWLFDCGEGAQQQILRTNIRPGRISRIFISHLHGDHLFGLPGLLSSRSFLGGGAAPLTLYGPVGLRRFVATALELSETVLSYPLTFVELDGPAAQFDSERFTITARLLEHRIASYGYRLEEKPRPGQLDIDALRALGVPEGALLGRLKRGETITLADGRRLNGADFIRAPRPGKIITLCGDSRPCAATLTLAAGADWLVHEATFLEEQASQARQFYHSTVAQACRLARDAGVKRLLLNHISARFGSEAPLLAEALPLFPATTLARDFLEIDLSAVNESKESR